MDRRAFILGVFAAAVGPWAAADAMAAPASTPEEVGPEVAEALDDLPLAYAQNWNQSQHWHRGDPRFRHPPRHGRRRQVCRIERDRWGRRVRRCRWVWV